MIAPEITIESLTRLVGREVVYQGLRCRVSEVLADPPTVVLEVLDAAAEITADNYGHPRRKGPRVIEVPVWREDGVLNAELGLIKPAGGKAR